MVFTFYWALAKSKCGLNEYNYFSEPQTDRVFSWEKGGNKVSNRMGRVNNITY